MSSFKPSLFAGFTIRVTPSCLLVKPSLLVMPSFFRWILVHPRCWPGNTPSASSVVGESWKQRGRPPTWRSAKQGLCKPAKKWSLNQETWWYLEKNIGYSQDSNSTTGGNALWTQMGWPTCFINVVEIPYSRDSDLQKSLCTSDCLDFNKHPRFCWWYSHTLGYILLELYPRWPALKPLGFWVCPMISNWPLTLSSIETWSNKCCSKHWNIGWNLEFPDLQSPYIYTIIYVYTLRMAEDRRKSCTHCTAGASEIPGRGLGRGKDGWSGEDQNEVEP